MNEARIAQRMGIQRGESARFRHPNVTLEADRTVVPCAEGVETVPVTLAVFPDHGRPAFVGSTIGSREVLRDAASDLTEAESQRLNAAMERTTEQLLNGGFIISDGIFTSEAEGKPDIHVIVIGDPHQDTSLRLYCHAGEYEGVPALLQDARVRKKGAGVIEKAFKREGEYMPPKNWDKAKATGRGGR